MIARTPATAATASGAPTAPALAATTTAATVATLATAATAPVMRTAGAPSDPCGALERRLGAALGMDDAVLCRSGRDGFLGLLLALELAPDDEIILPVSICQTMVNAVLIAGALPVLADCRPDLALCPADLARRVTPATRGIVAHHPHGAACRLDDIRAVARAAGALLVEDCAQAAGAFIDGAPVGQLGDVALHSFAPDKPLTAGSGGLVAARDPALAARLRAALRVGSPGHPDDQALGIDSLPRAPELAAIARALDTFPGDVAARIAKAEAMIDAMTETMTETMIAAMPGATPGAIVGAVTPWGRIVGRELAGHRPRAHVFHRVIVELPGCHARADVARVLAELRRTTPPALHAVVQDAVPVPPHRTPHVARAYHRRGRPAPGDDAGLPGWRAIERSYVFLRTSAQLSIDELRRAATALGDAARRATAARTEGATCHR
jgi:DegT/DnrJ/EryC1/StrS aminotransferase family protein